MYPKILSPGLLKAYRIYSCISRPFTTKKSAQKIALELYTSHTQRNDKAVQEISMTMALKCIWKTQFAKPVLIMAEFSAQSSTKKCEIIHVKCFKCKPTGDDFYCVFRYVEQTFLLELRCCLQR